MHEQAKLNEAKYFLDQLRVLLNEREKFNFNLSAFLAAARSALQYALEEAKTKSGGEAWYAGQVSGKPVVKFFKDKRDVSIHRNPVNPSAIIHASVTERALASVSFSATITRKDGAEEEDDSTGSSACEPRPQTPPQPEALTTEYEYVFRDWPGSEDVISLFEMYINEVGAIVSDGRAKGFLTP